MNVNQKEGLGNERAMQIGPKRLNQIFECILEQPLEDEDVVCSRRS